MNTTGRGRGYSRGGGSSNGGWTVVQSAGRARPPGQARGRGRPFHVPPPQPPPPAPARQPPPPAPARQQPQQPLPPPQPPPPQSPPAPARHTRPASPQPNNSQRSYEIVHHDDRYNPTVDGAKRQDPFYDHRAKDQNSRESVEITGQHAMAASIFVAAAQALGWSRDRLRIAMEDHSFTLASTPEEDPEHQNALQQIQYTLLHLTYIRTHWTSYAAAFLRIWPSVRGYKYGIKEKIKYVPGHHLLTFGVHWEGQHYDWKLDLDTQAAIRSAPLGTNAYQPTWEPMQSEVHARLLLNTVGQRVMDFYRHLHTTFHRDNTKRQKLQDLDSYTRRGTCSEFTMSLALQAADALKAVSQDNGSNFDHVDTSGVPLRASLGNVFWYEVAPEPYPPDADADVTFNPERKKQFAKTIQPAGKPKISVRVCQHYPARRQWGVHVHTENEKTIRFLNQMMPSVGMGWYEIFLTVGTTEFHFKLAPWQQPKTTFVQPFILAHKDSPLVTGNYPKKTVEYEGNTGEIPDPDQLQLPDFRTQLAQEFTVKALDPYLITGRGSEVDGMVHSLLAVEQDKVQALSAACLLMPREIMAMATREQDDTGEPDGPTRAANRVLQYMRAYYSTDNPTRPGNLNPFGEYSIFFFSCLNYVVGVQMYSPTIHYLNQRGGDDLHELPPRAAQTQAVVHVQEERGRARSRSTSRPARGESARYEVDRVPQQVLDRLEQTEKSMRDLMDALNRGGPQSSDLQSLEERLMKMIENTRHSADGVNASSASHVVQRAAYTDADTQIKKPDLTGGWRASFQDSDQDKAPNKLTMYGHPDFFSNDALTAVHINEAVTLTLDETRAREEGILVYKNENGHLKTYLYIKLRYEEGYREPFYVWAIQFMDNGWEREDLEDQHLDMDNFCLFKKQSRSVLALNSAKQKTFTWRATYDLKTWKPLGKYNWDITIDNAQNCEWVTRGNRNNWSGINTFLKYTIKPDGTLRKEKQTVTSTVAALSKVQGLGGVQYDVQLYGSYSGAPENDRVGVLNKYIGLKIYTLHYKRGNTEIKYDNEEIIRFELVDSELPEYVGEFEDTHDNETYTLTLTPYYSPTKMGGAYTWGLKSDGGLRGADGAFIAHIPDDALEPALMNRFNGGNLFNFRFDFEGNPIVVTAQDIVVRGMSGSMIERIPNYTTLQGSTEEYRLETTKGIFKPQGSKELARLMPQNRNDLIKRVHATAISSGRVCKYCLFVYHKDFSAWMNQYQLSKKAIKRFDQHNMPMQLKLEHTWLNGENARQKNIVYPESDYTLWLVDAQGPVWVSANGNYMICPYGDDHRKLKTWGLYRWDEHGLAYDIMATKEKKSGTHLISHDQFETAKSLTNTNTWRFYKLWTGKNITQDYMANQKFNEMRVVIIQQDPKKSVLTAPGNKPQQDNPYMLQVRMPDYTVPVSKEKLVNYTARNAAKQLRNGEDDSDSESYETKDQTSAAMGTLLAMDGEEEVQEGEEQGESREGTETTETSEKKKTIKQQQKATTETVDQILRQLAKLERQSSETTEEQRMVFRNTRIACQSFAQKIESVTDTFCITTMTDDWWDAKHAAQYDQTDQEWMSAIKKDMKSKLSEHFNDNAEIESLLETYTNKDKYDIEIIHDFIKAKQKQMIAKVLAVVIKTKHDYYLKRKEKARQKAEKQAKTNEKQKTKAEKDDKQTQQPIKPNVDKEQDLDVDKTFDVTPEEQQKRKAELLAKKHREEMEQKHKEELKRGKPTKNPGESEKQFGKRLREWQEKEKARQDAEKASAMNFAQEGDDVTKDLPEYSKPTPAAAQVDGDDDQDELENDVELIPLLIRAPTPWYDHMENVRHVLTRMTDYKNQAIQQQRDRNSQLQRIKEEQQKRYEEEEAARTAHIQQNKTRLITEKSSQEEKFKEKFDANNPRPTDATIKILSSCRVYSDSHSTLPTNLKVQFPSILKSGMKTVQTMEFTLVNPFTLTYISVQGNVVLGFQPRELENDQRETLLAWKFLLFRSNTQVSVDDPAITLGVKWASPQTLLTDSNGLRGSNELNSGEWRFRFRSIPGEKMLKSEKFKFDVLNLDQYKDSIKFVYYYTIDFTATLAEKNQNVLPEYKILATIQEDEDDAFKHIYSDSLEEAVLGAHYHRSVWSLTQLSSNPLRFFEMPSSLFMQFALTDQKSTAFFKLKGYDISGDFSLDTNKDKMYKFRDDTDTVEWVAQLGSSTFILREASVEEAEAPAAQGEPAQAGSGEERPEAEAGEAPAEASAVEEETGAPLPSSQKDGWEIWYSYTPSNASTPVEFKLLEYTSKVLLDNSGDWRVAAAPAERFTSKFKAALSKLGITLDTPGTAANVAFNTKTDVEDLLKHPQQLVVKWAARHWFTADHATTYISTDVGEGGRQHAEQTLALAAELGLDLAFCSHPFTCISVPAASYPLCGAAGPARATLLPLQPRKQAARARKLELPPVLSAAPQARCRPPLLSFRR